MLNFCKKCDKTDCNIKSIKVFDILFCMNSDCDGLYNIEKIRSLYYKTDKKRKEILLEESEKSKNPSLWNELSKTMGAIEYIFLNKDNIITLSSSTKREIFDFLKISKEFYEKYPD